MADYDYQDGKFSGKDALPSGDPNKIVKGSDFEVEFLAIETMSESKLNSIDPVFSGTLTGGSITLSGTYDGGEIDGGVYA